ncbi:MAG: glycosyltransferase [Dehalococcoidia bacterium]
MYRVAVISVHTSPMASPGGHKAGGMNVYVRELAREMGGRGYAVDVFTRRDGDMPQVVEMGGGVRVVHLEAGGESLANPEEAYLFLPRFLRSLLCFQEAAGLQYHLVHSHYWLSGWVGQMLARRWRAPHVTMFHTLGEAKNQARISERESPRRIKAEHRVAQTADRIVCASRDERNLLVRLYGVPAGCIRVVPCGVDLDLFRPMDKGEARRRLRLDDAPIILYVGRLEPLKGIDILLRAVAQLSDDVPFRLLIVGGDERSTGERRQLEGLAREIGIAERVLFAGAVDHHQLPLYYNAADVCAVPSYYESFGLVAVEAMACGTPVVATRVGGLAGTVRDGETGYLIPWRCPEPFADKLETLLINDELRQRLGQAARAAVEPYRWHSVADQVEAIYQELLAAPEEACCNP